MGGFSGMCHSPRCLSPAHATPLTEPSLLPANFAAGFIKETGTSSLAGITGAPELSLQEAAFPRLLPSQPWRPVRLHTAPVFLGSTFCPPLCQD